MRGRALHHSSSARSCSSLVVRGGIVRTFGGLACFLALTFLCAGIYILGDAMANPIEAQAAAVIAGAFTIALATILLFYLIKPREDSKTAAIRHGRDIHIVSSAKQSTFSNAPLIAGDGDARRDLAGQPLYVDHSRMPP
ncbi:MAG TPA: hypothetical protein VFN26_10790 [Candidatus Acidoferrum sp.]|nr:hypothetical protein [Candidatus Acidoferrum sp.]